MDNIEMQQILEAIGGLKQEVAELRHAQTQFEKNITQEVTDLRQSQMLFEKNITQEITDLRHDQTQFEKNITQEVTDLRHTQMLFEQNVTRQFGAINDQFEIIRGIGEASMDMLKETKALLDDDIAEKVAIGAEIVDLTRRVEVLERKAV